MTKPSDVCLHCGQTREAIKRKKTFCATVTYEGETDCEWSRHRFKPYSKKELEAMARDEAEYIKQMGEMADFVDSASKGCDDPFNTPCYRGGIMHKTCGPLGSDCCWCKKHDCAIGRENLCQKSTS